MTDFSNGSEILDSTPEAAMPRVAFVSHLFPNRHQPLHGVFVREGALATAKLLPTIVVAPVSHFPWIRSRKGLPLEDHSDELRTYHPRFLALPDRLYAWRWIPYYNAISRVLDQHITNIDLLHVHWTYPDAYAAIRYARKWNKKVVLTVHGHRAAGSFEPDSRKHLFASPLRLVDRIITVSTPLKEELVTSYQIPEEKISIIRNGFDPAKFSVKPKVGCRKQLGIQLDRPVVLTVARLSPEKALDALIEGVRLCARKDLLLYIIGDGPLRQALERQILESGLKDRVILVGGIPHQELNRWFSAADLFCLPSHTEGCPVVLHEALACGIPVVASAVGAIPEILHSPQYGLLCRPGCSEDLSNALAAAVQMSWSSEGIVAYGKQFSWDRVAKETIEVYKGAFA